MNTETNLSSLVLITNLPQLLEVCINRLNDAILITEAEPFNQPGPKILWANEVFYKRTGYTPEEVIGQTPRILQGPLTDRATLDKVRAALEQWQSVRAETLNYRKDGSTYWSEFEIVPIANEKGWYTHWVSVQRDITERKLLEQKIHQLAFHDALTQLPNRNLLNDRLSQVISASNRTLQYAALMFLDLDNFKPLNDTHGHAMGDLLLIEVARRLKSCVRETDTVARFGGDEFVVALSALSEDKSQSTTEARGVAEKILAMLSAPYLLNASRAGQGVVPVAHDCSASIGVVVFKACEGSQDDILKWADKALYQAKDAGRRTICFYQN